MTTNKSDTPVKILIIGPNGKMGKAMTQIGARHRSVSVVGGVGPKQCSYRGMDLAQIAGLSEPTGAIAHDSIGNIIDACDVVVECTNASASMDYLQACIAHNKALVSGTTGFSEEQRALFEAAGNTIPVVVASNTSKIAHIFFDVINFITARVGHEADIDIIEMHDRNKLDAPSGTSKEIGHNIAAIVGKKFDDLARYQRKGSGIRPEYTLDYTSIRSGTRTPRHTVMFGCDNEQIEVSYGGDNMLPYAEGMIQAALFITRQKPGCYSIEQVFAAEKNHSL